MALVSPYISIIILNVYGLNSPIKRHRVAGWIKNKIQLHASQKRPMFRYKDTHRLKVQLEWHDTFLTLKQAVWVFSLIHNIHHFTKNLEGLL